MQIKLFVWRKVHYVCSYFLFMYSMMLLECCPLVGILYRIRFVRFTLHSVHIIIAHLMTNKHEFPIREVVCFAATIHLQHRIALPQRWVHPVSAQISSSLWNTANRHAADGRDLFLILTVLKSFISTVACALSLTDVTLKLALHATKHGKELNKIVVTFTRNHCYCTMYCLNS